MMEKQNIQKKLRLFLGVVCLIGLHGPTNTKNCSQILPNNKKKTIVTRAIDCDVAGTAIDAEATKEVKELIEKLAQEKSQMVLPPYSGIPTFMRTPFYSDPSEVDIGFFDIAI